MNRRSFMQSILALGAAPAIVRADSLMRIVARDTTVITRKAELIPALLSASGHGYAVGDVIVFDGFGGPMDGLAFRVASVSGSTGVLLLEPR